MHCPIGMQRGLYSLKPETGRFQGFMQYKSFTELKDNSIYHFHDTAEGIWIGAASGLYLLKPGKGITARYSEEGTPPYNIPYGSAVTKRKINFLSPKKTDREISLYQNLKKTGPSGISILTDFYRLYPKYERLQHFLKNCFFSGLLLDQKKTKSYANNNPISILSLDK